MFDIYERLIKRATYFSLFLLLGIRASSQTLTLKDAVNTALNNYGTVKAKSNYLKSSQASAKEASTYHLPNLNLAAQQAYGTANGQFGPVVPIGGFSVASSGPPFLTQNWNAAFGGLYLANISWDFFTFGRVRENVKVAEAQVLQDASDLDQEKFQLRGEGFGRLSQSVGSTETGIVPAEKPGQGQRAECSCRSPCKKWIKSRSRLITGKRGSIQR